MIRQLRTSSCLNQTAEQLFQQALRANQVLRRLVILKQLIQQLLWNLSHTASFPKPATPTSVLAASYTECRTVPRKKGLTRPDKRIDTIPDLVQRDFTVSEPDKKWCGDFKQIDTLEGPTYLSSCEDLFSRRLLGFALSDDYPNAELAKAAINMAVATRGGVVAGVIFHTDKGTQYTSDAFATACDKLGITQSMGRVGSAHDNAVAESFFSTLEHERLTRRTYTTRVAARQDVARWIDDFYNRRRKHSTNGMKSPIDYETEHRKLQSETAEAA